MVIIKVTIEICLEVTDEPGPSCGVKTPDAGGQTPPGNLHVNSERQPVEQQPVHFPSDLSNQRFENSNLDDFYLRERLIYCFPPDLLEWPFKNLFPEESNHQDEFVLVEESVLLRVCDVIVVITLYVSPSMMPRPGRCLVTSMAYRVELFGESFLLRK